MKINGYAYLDEYGILHATKHEETAKEYAYKGKYVATDLVSSHGYLYENGEKVFIYVHDKEFYIGGNAEGGTPIKEEDFAKKYPEAYAIYKELISVGLDELTAYEV